MDTLYIHEASILQHTMKTSNKCCQDLIKEESGLMDMGVNMLKWTRQRHTTFSTNNVRHGYHTKESPPYCEASLSFVQTYATFAIVNLPHPNLTL